jgi:hypothetical protein
MNDVAELMKLVSNASLYTLLWYLLYDAYASSTPKPGPSEKKTCVAAEFEEMYNGHA